MAAAVHTDDAYKRLTRTIDLTGVGAADKPKLRTRLSCATPSPATTTRSSRPTRSAPTTGPRCPRRAVRTRTAVPTECEAGFYVGEHPLLQALPDRRAPRGCAATGHQRRVEQLHRRLQRLAAGRLRPERVRGQDRSRSRSATSPTRAPAATACSSTTPRLVVGGARRGHRGLRDLPRSLDRPGPPGGQPGRRCGTGRATGDLFQTYGAVTTRRHGAARLRPGARRRRGRPRGPHRQGARLRAEAADQSVTISHPDRQPAAIRTPTERVRIAVPCMALLDVTPGPPGR